MCKQNPLHEDSNGFDTCDGLCDYPPDDEDTTKVEEPFTWDRAVKIMDGGKAK